MMMMMMKISRDLKCRSIVETRTRSFSDDDISVLKADEENSARRILAI